MYASMHVFVCVHTCVHLHVAGACRDAFMQVCTHVYIWVDALKCTGMGQLKGTTRAGRAIGPYPFSYQNLNAQSLSIRVCWTVNMNGRRL